MKRILFVVGARPNFMKIAPIMEAMRQHADEFAQLLVHTGQHYDTNMSQVFFDELGLPKPDINLEVGSGPHAQQTAQVMQRFEPVLLANQPDWIVVPGDVNSTLACALVASKLGTRVAHVEAGLRSFDRTMPEEINRVLVDQISDLLLTPSEDANANLLREGIPHERIHFVGNVMIDTLIRLLPKAIERWPALTQRYKLDRFMLVTLHRPANVDSAATLTEIVQALNTISHEIPIVFPIHPRTRKRVESLGLTLHPQRIHLLEPLGYLDFLAVQANAHLVLTDSGGVQEETTYLGIPCLTVRANTERPITVTQGTNILIECSARALTTAAARILLQPPKNTYTPPKYWDGHAAERIVTSLYTA